MPLLTTTLLTIPTTQSFTDPPQDHNNNQLHHRPNYDDHNKRPDTTSTPDVVPTFRNLPEQGRNRKESWRESSHNRTNKENESAEQTRIDDNVAAIKVIGTGSESHLPSSQINHETHKRTHKQAAFDRVPQFSPSWDSSAPGGQVRSDDEDGPEKRKIEDAVEYGLRSLQELLEIKEPRWHSMGLYLDKNEPASHVANFGAPGKKALELSRLGYAAIEASRRIAQTSPQSFGRQSAGFRSETRLLHDECPLRGLPRCPPASRRYRTADGTCNSFNRPWRGSSLLPMQRFLAPVYEDGIQEVRRSVSGGKLPSARDISSIVHRDSDVELEAVNLMFMQWGQFVDHDITSTVKSRSFNGSVPRCCGRGGLDFLIPELTHPSCLPIEVSASDWFLGPLGIRCVEFIRSAPSTRINCDLGWREQLNQVTSYLDASTIYGSDVETSDSMRNFRNGKLQYGRPQGREPLRPPDPPGGELCRSGALTPDCFQGGDGRLSEQPGLTAVHTIWLRYHNKVAAVLGQINGHWSDEKIYQETRRVVVALVQHITYREFLPIVLGKEVMELFELVLERKGYWKGYDERVNPAVSNSFSTAAFRFGHSLVQNSYVRTDIKHRPLFNNVSLHEEQENIENIWSFGSIDRLLLGFCNQPSQRRDEFICEELTNHLFQSRDFPFGMDLAAINVQRGRDHGLPPYTSWRQPCHLSPITSWSHLQKIMSPATVQRLKSLYRHVDDIDLFTGGLAEKPVRGGVVGPTFACIIAQQFSNLRKGDRFWYENGGFESSFTPAQLQQIRHVTFAQILCQTLTEIETVQPFVFLAADDFRNSRISCDDPQVNNFDLTPWLERHLNDVDGRFDRKSDAPEDRTGRKTKRTKTDPPLKIKITNITTETVKLQNKQYDRPGTYVYKRPSYDDVTYLVGRVTTSTPAPRQTPIELNIKIQYYLPTTVPTTKKTKKPTQKRKRPNNRPSVSYDQPSKPSKTTKKPVHLESGYPIYAQSSASRPPQYGYVDTKPSDIYSDDFAYRPVTTKRPYVVRPQDFYDQDPYGGVYEDRPFSTSKRPYVYRPNSNHYVYSDVYSTTRRPQYDQERPTKFPPYLYTNNRPNSGYKNDAIDKFYSEVLDRLDYDDIPKRPTFGQVYQQQTTNNQHYGVAHIERIPTDRIHDKLDFHTSTKNQKTKFVKISSVKGTEILGNGKTKVQFSLSQREGDLDLGQYDDDFEVRMVDIDVLPPSEDRWVFYNATDEIMTLMQVPDFNKDETCSNELPKPLNRTGLVDNDDGSDAHNATEVPENMITKLNYDAENATNVPETTETTTRTL